MNERRIRELADALAEIFPDEPPLSDESLRYIAESVDEAPPMTDRQRRRIGLLLFGERIATKMVAHLSGGRR
jgi:hypothetical protein